MLINDLTKNNIIKSFRSFPFLLTCDADVKTPAIIIIDADDKESLQMAESRGYPVIKYENGVFLFPNGWKLTQNKTDLIKTKIFQLMKKFYQLPNEIHMFDNLVFHLVNDWSESKERDRWRCGFVILVLLSSCIYGGALKTEWFLRYSSEKSLRGVLSYYFREFPVRFQLSNDLIYLRSIPLKNRKYDFYFYEQDFCGECKIASEM